MDLSLADVNLRLVVVLVHEGLALVDEMMDELVLVLVDWVCEPSKLLMPDED